jgi:hypothetical protein
VWLPMHVLDAEAQAATDIYIWSCSCTSGWLRQDHLISRQLHSEEDHTDPSSITCLWHQIRETGRNFTNFTVMFVRREGKDAAHVCLSVLS